MNIDGGNNNDDDQSSYFRDNHYIGPYGVGGGGGGGGGDNSPSSFSHLTTATYQNNNNTDNDNGGSTDGPMIIRVIAPATLLEGYTFDVLVDDEPYTVSVPPGGIQAGEEFDVLYEPENDHTGGNNHNNSSNNPNNRLSDMPEEGSSREGTAGAEDDETSAASTALQQKRPSKSSSYLYDQPKKTDSMGDESTMAGGEGGGKSTGDGSGNYYEDNDDGDATATQTIWYDQTGTPIGNWRTSLCSCCDVITQSTFWMGFFFTPILMAQLITRLKLTWRGIPDAPIEETSLSYNRIVLSYLVVALTLWKIPVVGGLSLVAFYLVTVVYIGSQVRSHMRSKYKIPITACGCPKPCADRFAPSLERIDDGFTMFVCGCCASIQMARHTHDDKDYPGHGCTTTGLGMDAPNIV